MDSSLIIDVGMHVGRDTDFYLQKGFRVVAVEAHPDLAARGRERFSREIADGRLTIHEVAIAEHEGEVTFYVNSRQDDWGTISPAFAARNEEMGTTNRAITVPSTPFQTILREHGIPYYLKVDIEGADLLCLRALADFESRPRYVSIESGLTSFEETFEELSLLWSLGYRTFKIVDQAQNEHVRCPNPPFEGQFVDYRFDATSSGPFGEEAPGTWMRVEETIDRYRRLLTEQKYFGGTGKLNTPLIRKPYEILTGRRVGWYDIHARLGDG